MDFVIAVLGLVILVLAGDMLVRGAVNVSLRLGVPALIVSLTIVALGTSAPELLVSISAVIEGAPGIAVGNVVGSNIANVLLVLGLPAMLVGLNTTTCNTKISYMQMIVATMLFILIAFLQPITWVHGLVLLGFFAITLGHAGLTAVRHRRDDRLEEFEDVESADPNMPWWRIFVFLLLGLIGLPLGAKLLVDSASDIARTFSISETIIGLTLVAIGTSLPELATTVSAAYRRQADVALGNVIGSNIANLLAIIGISTFFGDIPVSQHVMSWDIWVMAASSAVLFPFIFLKMNMTRTWGTILTGLYVVYVIQMLV